MGVPPVSLLFAWETVASFSFEDQTQAGPVNQRRFAPRFRAGCLCHGGPTRGSRAYTNYDPRRLEGRAARGRTAARLRESATAWQAGSRGHGGSNGSTVAESRLRRDGNVTFELPNRLEISTPLHSDLRFPDQPPCQHPNRTRKALLYSFLQHLDVEIGRNAFRLDPMPSLY